MSITDARVANPFERDRIGSLGQEQTGYDLYQKEKIAQTQVYGWLKIFLNYLISWHLQFK